MNLPLPRQSYQSRSRPLSSQRLLNLILEKSGDPQAGTEFMLIGTPGLMPFFQLPGASNPPLGMMFLHQYLVVADTTGVRVVKVGDNNGFSIKFVPWSELQIIPQDIPADMIFLTNDARDAYFSESQENADRLVENKYVLIGTQGHYVMQKYIGAADEAPVTYDASEWEEIVLDALSPATTTVQMTSNGDDVVLLNAESGKLVVVNGDGDLPDGWSIRLPAQTDANVPFYTSVSYLSGVFFATCSLPDPVSGQPRAYVKFGDVLDPDTWQYAFQLDTGLDALVGSGSNMREAWIFSPTSIEVLYATGKAGNNFFAHIQGAYINKGTNYKNSICSYEDIFLFYGSDDVIYQSKGTTVQAISTPAILNMVKEWGKPSDIIGQIYSQNGHSYYLLKFKGLGKTLMFDLTTGSWIERESGYEQEWIGEYVIRQPNGKLFVSDIKSATIYSMDNEFFTDNGTPIAREFVFPTLTPDSKTRMFYYSLMIDMDSGLGPNDSIALTWSNDGGYTWSKERVMKLGAKGEYSKKIVFRRLGSAISRTFKVRMTTASMVNILRADMNAEEGQ